jgi:hypothetical protein
VPLPDGTKSVSQDPHFWEYIIKRTKGSLEILNNPGLGWKMGGEGES